MPCRVFDLPRTQEGLRAPGLTCPVGSLTCLKYRRTHVLRKVFEVPKGGIFLVVIPNKRTNRPKGSAITQADDRKYKTLRWQDRYHDEKKRRRQFARTTENDSQPNRHGRTSCQTSNFHRKGDLPLKRVRLGLCFLIHGLFGQEKAVSLAIRR